MLSSRAHLFTGFELASLPNAEGFRFRGITHEGDLLPCVVLKDANGHYAALVEDGSRIFGKLRGWYQYPPPGAAG